MGRVPASWLRALRARGRASAEGRLGSPSPGPSPTLGETQPREFGETQPRRSPLQHDRDDPFLRVANWGQYSAEWRGLAAQGLVPPPARAEPLAALSQPVTRRDFLLIRDSRRSVPVREGHAGEPAVIEEGASGSDGEGEQPPQPSPRTKSRWPRSARVAPRPPTDEVECEVTVRRRAEEPTFGIELTACRSGGPAGLWGRHEVAVTALSAGGAAERSGQLRVGDKFLMVNGQSVTSMPADVLSGLITQSGPEVRFTVSRQRSGHGASPARAHFKAAARAVMAAARLVNATRLVPLRLPRRASSATIVPITVELSRREGELLGLRLATATPPGKARGAPAGMVVSGLVPGSRAEASGEFRLGDALLAVNSIQVEGKTHEQVVALISGGGTDLVFTLGRAGAEEEAQECGAAAAAETPPPPPPRRVRQSAADEAAEAEALMQHMRQPSGPVSAEAMLGPGPPKAVVQLALVGGGHGATVQHIFPIAPRDAD